MQLSNFLALASSVLVLVPAVLAEVRDGQTGVVMALPPDPTDTSLKRIPDAAHPFQAPGPDDQRGPCPAMNTLANHGYIPRNGIASFEDLVSGMAEAFNLPVSIGSGLAANNMLTRGNIFINKLSIGGVSPLIPPLPGKIDGPETRGIAAHGRVEGDASITRADAAIGNSVEFQNILYDEALLQLGKFGDDGPDGPSTVLNIRTLIGIHNASIVRDQAADPKFTLNAARMNGIFADDGLILNAWANGTTKLTTLAIFGSFFRNQTFPNNWFRSNGPIQAAVIGPISSQTRTGVGIAPGRNNKQGVYVVDSPPPAPWNSSFACTAYWDQNGHISAALANPNITGIFKQNIDFLLNITFKGASANSGCTEPIAPFGAIGI